ncbi:MAG: DUF3987 domain-containing protein [Phycisphaerae bacterium]|nr:DUF3987 domain-containing protein [Phycisphaerae bacterium]
MKPIELVLSKLSGAKRCGQGWQAQCPAHEDRRPSLSISEGEGGRALVHCHAGCTAEAIVAAIGLTMANLMPESRTTARSYSTSARKHTAKAPAQLSAIFATADEAMAELVRQYGLPAATWTYQNAESESVGVIARWNTNKGKKIRPVSKTPAGWIIGGMPEPRSLYRLPELLARPDEPIYICEGEKCCDALAELGLLATTSSHGSKSAGKADWTPLAGRDVVILPDNDEAGEKYATEVVAILAKLTSVPCLRVVRLYGAWPNLPKAGDIADVVECGESTDAIKAKLVALVDATEPEPITIPVLAVEPFKPFPTDKLPEPVRSFVDKASQAIGCDSSFIALPLLTGLASAIGNTRRIQIKNGWSEPAILWTVIVGDSGTLKSPAIELALRPIRTRQREAMKQHAQAMEAYKAELNQYNRAYEAWKRGKDHSDPPEAPVEPVADRYYCDDVTIEALAALLDKQFRGLLCVRDELAGWFGAFDRYSQGKGGGDVAKWLEMFGGRALMVDRKSGNPRTIYIPYAAVSVTGGIQPETLRRALGAEYKENGLAARLLPACPPRRPKKWTEADIDAETEAAVGNVFHRLYELQPGTNFDGEPIPWLVPMTPTAKAAWIEFYNTHAQEQAELTGDLSAAWSKLEGYAARLALVVHFIRWAACDPTLQSPDAVDETSIAVGVALSRWFGHEARRVYAILAEGDEGREQRRLIELIQCKGGSITTRELQQSSRDYRKSADAEAALSELILAGIGRWEDRNPAPNGGRPTRVFRLSKLSQPSVDELPIGADEVLSDK